MQLNELVDRYRKGTDREKVSILLEMQYLEKSKELADFLLDVAKKEHYERLKIQAIMILAAFDDEDVINEVKGLYAFEKEDEIRLALISKIGKNPKESINDLLMLAAERDKNERIRGLALSYLHERNIEKEKMKNLIIKVLEKDKEVFPKIIALNIIMDYLDESILERLLWIYEKERRRELRKKLAKKIREVAEKVGKTIKLNQWEDEEEKPEDLEKRKKKKEKKKKKENKDRFLYLVEN